MIFRTESWNILWNFHFLPYWGAGIWKLATGDICARSGPPQLGVVLVPLFSNFAVIFLNFQDILKFCVRLVIFEEFKMVLNLTEHWRNGGIFKHLSFFINLTAPSKSDKNDESTQCHTFTSRLHIQWLIFKSYRLKLLEDRPYHLQGLISQNQLRGLRDVIPGEYL